MKFFNGLTNIGIFCGFATQSNPRTIEVHQCCALELAPSFELTETARDIEFDYEPVSVLFRIEGSQAGPRLCALHVSRLAKALVPRTFHWNSSHWPRSQEFYPFQPTRAGTLSDWVASKLVPHTSFPQQIMDHAQDDDVLRAMLNRPTSNKHLLNRFLYTGLMTRGEIFDEESCYPGYYMRVSVRQGETTPVGMKMAPGASGYNFLNSHKTATTQSATVLGKLIPAYKFDGQNLSEVSQDLFIIDAGVVSTSDLED